MTAFIILGVSGVGKSTIGSAVAEKLRLPFIEADEYHPAANVAKMSAGIPLTDADRTPWIDHVAAAVNIAGADVIVACSALTRFVRDRLRRKIRQPVIFVYLKASPQLIQERLDHRPQHFMKPGMLGSQLATLEPPANALEIDASQARERVVQEVIDRIGKEGSG